MNFVSSYKYTSCHFLPSNGSREIGKSNFLSINFAITWENRDRFI